MSKDPAPISLLELSTCTCKKKECSSNCSCVNVGLSCTEARTCMAEDTCKNPHGVEWELEDRTCTAVVCLALERDVGVLFDV